MNHEEKECLPGMDFRNALGIQLIEAHEGYAKYEMPILPHHNNVLGILHGGVLFTLADTTSGMAVRTYGSDYVNTVSSNINFLRPGKDTAKLVAEAQVVKCGKTLAVVNAEVRDDKGTLLVTTNMTFMLFH